MDVESRRILWNKKTALLFLGLLIVNLFQFYYFSLKDYYPLEAEEVQTIDYEKKYHDIEQRINSISKISIFSDDKKEQSVEQMKTLHDYKKIKNVKAVTERSEGISLWMTNTYGNYFVLVFLIYLVFTCFATEKKGLFPLVYSAKRGRFFLSLKHLILIFFSAAGSTFIVQGSMIVAAYMKSGNVQSLWKPIQCIHGFENCILPVNGLQFMLLSIVVDAGAIIVLALFIWFSLLLIHNNKIAMAICGMIFSVEYFFTVWILPQSRWALLKEFNLISLLETKRLFQQYRVICIGNVCLERMEWHLLLIVVFIVILGIMCLIVGMKRRPFYQERWLERFLRFICEKIRQLLSGLPGFCFEWYKILFSQKRILVFLLLVLAITKSIWRPTSNQDQVLIGSKSEYMDDFYTKYEGPVNAKTLDYIRRAQKGVDELMETESPVAGYYITGLKEVEKRVEYVKKCNYRCWLVNDRGYQILFGKKGGQKRDENRILIILCLVLMLTGIYSFENKSSMAFLLRTLPKGRKKLHLRKIGVTASLVVFLWMLYSFVEIYDVWCVATLSAWRAPVQSLPFLNSVTLPISIWQYYVLMLLLRLTVMMVIAFLFLKIAKWRTK